MDLQLTGKRALVTGSSSGIGEGIAKALASEGATVLVHGRSAPRAQAVAAAIKEVGGRAEVVLGDLATDDGAAEVARQALADGPVDILVNNAGFYENRTWWTATPEDWVATLQSDLLSSVRLIQALVPAMKARGWGRVIQIGSGTGAQPFAGYPQYCAVNAARTNAAVSLAREMKGTGVTSNIVSPGLVVTDAVRDWFKRSLPSTAGAKPGRRSRRALFATFCRTMSADLVSPRRSRPWWPFSPVRYPASSQAQTGAWTAAALSRSTKACRLKGGGVAVGAKPATRGAIIAGAEC